MKSWMSSFFVLWNKCWMNLTCCCVGHVTIASQLKHARRSMWMTWQLCNFHKPQCSFSECEFQASLFAFPYLVGTSKTAACWELWFWPNFKLLSPRARTSSDGTKYHMCKKGGFGQRRLYVSKFFEVIYQLEQKCCPQSPQVIRGSLMSHQGFQEEQTMVRKREKKSLWSWWQPATSSKC